MAERFNKKNTTKLMIKIRDKIILIVGAGAIGSLIAEMLVRNGALRVVICDIDKYEDGNIPKSSFIIHYPEDIGKEKAIVLAKRLQCVSANGSKIIGYDLNAKQIGPLALKDFDYVVSALDNAAMKIHMQRMIKMCPIENRPVYLSCGTNEEFSEAIIFNDASACLRCTIPDSWLKESASDTVWSCAAKVNYLLPEKLQAPISTSGVAGMKSALDIDDMILDHANGIREYKESTRVTRSIFPDRMGTTSVILPMKDCPVCSITPPDDITMVNGSAKTTSLRELLVSIQQYFDADFRLKVHELLIPGYPDHIYNQFVLYDRCRNCGAKMRIMKHSGFIREDEIVCDCCTTGGKRATGDNETIEAETVYSFSLTETPDEVLDMKLFELGYPIGSYYDIEEIKVASNSEEQLLDEFSIEIEESKKKTFALSGDTLIS